MSTIHENDHLFRAMVQTLREGLLLLTPDLKVSFANDAFYRIFQTTPNETLDHKIFAIGQGQWNTQPLRSLLEKLEREQLEFRDMEIFQRFEGIGEKTMIINARRLMDEHNPSSELILMAIEDATERKILERERDEALRSREELIGIVSHEIRNPLTTILTSLDIIRMTLPAVGVHPETPKMLENISTSAHRMERITTDLLDMTRIDAGELAIHIEDTPVQELLDEVMRLYEPEARMLGVRTSWATPSAIGSIGCDRGRIIQVLSNLVGNALKFTQSGGEVQVSAERLSSSAVRFSVSDTGRGIPASELPRVFQRFWQAKHKQYVGTGLGLYISNRLVTAHGGALQVNSQEGKGSTFSFTLPAAQSTERAA